MSANDPVLALVNRHTQHTDDCFCGGRRNERKPIVRYGSNAYTPALNRKHELSEKTIVKRLFTISTFDLVLMRWVEVEPCQR